MPALKITINQAPPTIAGADNIDVFHAMITCRGKLGPDAERGEKSQAIETFIDLGGMTLAAPGAPAEHLHWMEGRALRPGDRIRIEMLDSPHADPVVRRCPVEHPDAEEQERRMFEYCRDTYLALKETYETE